MGNVQGEMFGENYPDTNYFTVSYTILQIILAYSNNSSLLFPFTFMHCVAWYKRLISTFAQQFMQFVYDLIVVESNSMQTEPDVLYCLLTRLKMC